MQCNEIAQLAKEKQIHFNWCHLRAIVWDGCGCSFIFGCFAKKIIYSVRECRTSPGDAYKACTHTLRWRSNSTQIELRGHGEVHFMIILQLQREYRKMRRKKAMVLPSLVARCAACVVLLANQTKALTHTHSDNSHFRPHSRVDFLAHTQKIQKASHSPFHRTSCPQNLWCFCLGRNYNCYYRPL